MDLVSPTSHTNTKHKSRKSSISQVSADTFVLEICKRNRSQTPSTKGDIDVIKHVMIFHYIFITQIITWKKSKMETSDESTTVSRSSHGYEPKVPQRRSCPESLLTDLCSVFQPPWPKSGDLRGAKILKSKF